MGERKSANRLKNIQKFDLVIRLTFQISGEKMVCSLNVTGKRAVAWPKKKKGDFIPHILYSHKFQRITDLVVIVKF